MIISYVQAYYLRGTILLHKDENYLCKVVSVYINTSKFSRLPYDLYVELHNKNLLIRDIEDFVIYDPKIHSNVKL